MEVKESKIFIQNSYILMVGYFLSTAISTIGTVLIIRLTSVEEFSFINIAYIIPNILITFSELGLNYASTHFIARKMSQNDTNGVRDVIRINLYVKMLIGSFLTIFVAFFSIYIAKEIYNIDDARMIILIQIASIGIISSILYEALNSIFLGALNMKTVQLGSILRTSLRSTLSIILILLGFTLKGPLIGYVLSTLIVDIFYLFSLRLIYPKKEGNKSSTDWKELLTMLRYGYPLLLGSFIIAIETEIYFLILSYYGYIPEISYLSIAFTSGALIGILKKAISQSLFPVFSKKDWDIEKDKNSLINYYLFSLKFETFLIIPVAIFIILFSRNFFYIIFGEKYEIAAPFISTYFLIYLLIPIGAISIPAFFNGQKQTRVVLFMETINLIVSVIIALSLIPFFAGLGVVLGIIIGKTISIIYGNIIIYKKYGRVLFNNLKTVLLIFLMAVISGIITYIIYFSIVVRFIAPEGMLNNILIITISFGVYLGLFLFLIGIFLLITLEEIDLMVKSFQIIPGFSKIFYLLGRIEKTILRIRSKPKS